MIVAVALSIPFVVILATRPVLRRLAFRNAVRRPRETLLVITGSMLATALMTAAFVVGDTFNASIKANAYTQLGPVDEIVTAPTGAAGDAIVQRLRGFTNRNVDGVLQVSTSGGSAATLRSDGTALRAAPTVQLLELDFRAAHAFGGDPSASGISGAGPRAGEAVVVDGLARKLGVHVGDRVSAFAFGHHTTLRVARTIAQRGVSGLWLRGGSGRARAVVSYNLFVAPGTIARLARGAAPSAEFPTTSVLVSNVGGVESGATHTDAVVHALQRRLDGLAIAVVTTAKQSLLDEAKATGESLTQLYRGLGSFAVLAGVLLMINIFLMLSDERKPELGMMRAMGMRRRSLVAAFSSEGWLYAMVACACGTALGLGLGRLVIVGAAKIFSGADPEVRLPIRFHFETASLQNGFVIGLVIALTTVVFTSIATSRFNIIQAIRDLERRPRGQGVAAQLFWMMCIGFGGFGAFGGIAQESTPLIILGPAVAILGVWGLAKDRVPRRTVNTSVSAGVVLWGIAAVPLAAAMGADLEITAFVVQGIVLVIASVVLITEYQNELGHALARLTRRNLTVRLGLAYPLARRVRTALTVGQFSIVVFVLVYISVISSMFRGQADTLTHDVSGGYNVIVNSNPANPLSFGELRSKPDVRAVAPLVTLTAEITPAGADKATRWQMTGFDQSYFAAAPPKLRDRGAFASDRAAYQYVLSHPGTAIVDDFFLAARAGPPVAAVRVSDTITVADPASGRSMKVTVVAKGATDWIGNGGLVGAPTMRRIFGDSAAPTRAYVLATDPIEFAATMETSAFAHGVKAEALRTTIDKVLARQMQFFTLMRAFLAVGLVIGIAGIGVIMVRAVRERRRQVAVLRSLGFHANRVSTSFAVEATFVALEGVLIGVLLGFVCTWSITLSSSFGEGLSFRVPPLAISVLVASTLVGALAATIGPARSAAKIRPAVALRITD